MQANDYSLLTTNLLHLNQIGLFPAPGQNEVDFQNKVDFVLSQNPVPNSLPQLIEPFGVQPSWVSIQFSNEGLHFWEGAALWQEQTDAGFMWPQIQISKRMQRFYSKQELIAHEIVHAVRSDFVEEQFEEVLAYATSPKAWRRFLGPFFRNPREVTLFLWILVVSLGAQFFGLAVFSGWLLIPWLPMLAMGAGLIRLFKTQRQFRRCLQNLTAAIRQSDQALAVALRLSDQEMICFSQLTPEAIRAIAQTNSSTSLRWKMLTLCYF